MQFYVHIQFDWIGYTWAKFWTKENKCIPFLADQGSDKWKVAFSFANKTRSTDASMWFYMQESVCYLRWRHFALCAYSCWFWSSSACGISWSFNFVRITKPPKKCDDLDVYFKFWFLPVLQYRSGVLGGMTASELIGYQSSIQCDYANALAAHTTFQWQHKPPIQYQSKWI